MPLKIQMGEGRVRDVLHLCLKDYLASYDRAKSLASFTVSRSVYIDMEKVMGKCVQRVAFLEKAISGNQKAAIKDALTQCLDDVNAAYEDARESAETCLVAERADHEKRKAHCIFMRHHISAALSEIT